jgi:hypothetical protein
MLSVVIKERFTCNINQITLKSVPSVDTCKLTCFHSCVDMYIHIHIHICIHMYVHTYICPCVLRYMQMYVCMYRCFCICMYTHNCMCTYISSCLFEIFHVYLHWSLFLSVRIDMEEVNLLIS